MLSGFLINKWPKLITQVSNFCIVSNSSSLELIDEFWRMKLLQRLTNFWRTIRFSYSLNVTQIDDDSRSKNSQVIHQMMSKHHKNSLQYSDNENIQVVDDFWPSGNCSISPQKTSYQLVALVICSSRVRLMSASSLDDTFTVAWVKTSQFSN